MNTIAGLGGSLVLVLFANTFSIDAKADLLRPDDGAVVERGAAVYDKQCASCHGKTLEGQADWRTRKADGKLPAPPHNETGHTWHHPDKLLFAITKYGLKKFAGADYKTDMPAYEGVLSDEDILAVLSFIKSRWPAEVRQHHDAINASAQ